MREREALLVFISSKSKSFFVFLESRSKVNNDFLTVMEMGDYSSVGASENK
jgi:hypothetical protein